MYLKNILDLLPQTYKVHLIGYKNDNFDLSAYKNVIHEGFVDIKEYLSKNNFFCAFSRGGYATMDLVIRNIPTFCIYNRNDNAYLELLDKHNFTKLSEHNFVTYKLFNNKYFIEKFKEIENNRNLYCCQEELIDSNNSKLMNDYFENI